jgi:hypothetical protein
MAYVFGMNIPLLEMLLVFVILLGIGLILILVELRRLGKLLTEERTVLHEFETDLDRFENDEGKSSQERLQTYIKEALAKGMPTEQIADILRKRGWEEDKIQQYLKPARPSTPSFM